jgi:hypothetical protein
MECQLVFTGNQVTALRVGVPVAMTERVEKVLAILVNRQAKDLLEAFRGITPEEETALTIALINLPNGAELRQWWLEVIERSMELARQREDTPPM